jgi:hypothetical protein
LHGRGGVYASENHARAVAAGGGAGVLAREASEAAGRAGKGRGQGGPEARWATRGREAGGSWAVRPGSADAPFFFKSKISKKKKNTLGL